MKERLKELLEGYRKMYMSELLSEPVERIAYLEGIMDGLEMALKVIEDNGKGKSL